MKAFIAGIVTLFILCTGVFFCTSYITKKTDRLIFEIESLPNSCNSADLSSLDRLWEDSRFIFSLTVHRKAVDEIDDTIEVLKKEQELASDLGFSLTRTKLLSITKRLRATQAFSLSRIF